MQRARPSNCEKCTKRIKFIDFFFQCRRWCQLEWFIYYTFFHQGQLKFVKIQNICLLSLVLTKCICARTAQTHTQPTEIALHRRCILCCSFRCTCTVLARRHSTNTMHTFIDCKISVNSTRTRSTGKSSVQLDLCSAFQMIESSNATCFFPNLFCTVMSYRFLIIAHTYAHEKTSR